MHLDTVLLQTTGSAASSLTAPVATVIAALIAAFLGSFMAHLLTKRRDFESKEREAAMRHVQRQLEEFYGPLAGLITESKILFDTACHILPTVNNQKREIDASRFQGSDIDRWRFFIETYWFPINQQIVHLLRTKVYLLEEDQLPPSFVAFIRHAATFEALHRLWKEKGLETKQEVAGIGWPTQFGPDVEVTLVSLKSKYDAYRGKSRSVAVRSLPPVPKPQDGPRTREV